jgi:hypothetical protein
MVTDSGDGDSKKVRGDSKSDYWVPKSFLRVSSSSRAAMRSSTASLIWYTFLKGVFLAAFSAAAYVRIG